MKYCQRWMERVRAIESEFRAVESAVTLLETKVSENPNWGERYGWKARDAAPARRNLEATYTVRLFAEFESAVRDLWADHFKKRTRPNTEVLLNRVGSLCSLAQDTIDGADRVRAYRNRLVHERGQDSVGSMTITLAKSRLCTYLKGFPRSW